MQFLLPDRRDTFGAGQCSASPGAGRQASCRVLDGPQHGTRDATAVTFANVQLSADSIAYQPPQLSSERLLPNQVLISWPANPSGYLLQSSPSLPGTGLWDAVTNGPGPSGTRRFVTNAVEGDARFYRLKRGP